MSKKKTSKGKRGAFFRASRSVHVYCSTFLFALLIFFSITGIFLNHRWYDQDSNKDLFSEREIPADQLLYWGVSPEQPWQPDTTSIAEYIYQQHDLNLPTSIELDPDVGELIFEYKVPAGYAIFTLDTHAGILFIEMQEGSAVGILNDLHKGRHSGGTWSWVIDLSAALICLFSITGMIILFQGKKYTTAGLISAIAGVITPVALYFLFVPSVNA